MVKGRRDLSGFSVKFGDTLVQPSSEVKWVGLWLDGALTGRKHVETRAAAAARMLNASILVMHALWGLHPVLIRDLIRSTIFPRADYAIATVLPLSPTIKPLERVNHSAARCITGCFRTTSLAAMEKEAAILPVHLRIERDALLTVARFLTLPKDHGIHLENTICTPPGDAKMVSLYHYVEHIPGVVWPMNVPERGQRLRGKGTEARREEAKDGVVVDATLSMKPIQPVYAPPSAESLPVTTIIAPKESVLQALEYALRDERVKRATWFTDGSLPDGRVGGAAVRMESGREWERLWMLLGAGQVCEGEMEGLLMATESSVRRRSTHILCVVDSQAALRGILSTSPRSGQFRAIQYNLLVRSAQEHTPHLSITTITGRMLPFAGPAN